LHCLKFCQGIYCQSLWDGFKIEICDRPVARIAEHGPHPHPRLRPRNVIHLYVVDHQEIGPVELDQGAEEGDLLDERRIAEMYGTAGDYRSFSGETHPFGLLVTAIAILPRRAKDSPALWAFAAVEGLVFPELAEETRLAPIRIFIEDPQGDFEHAAGFS